MHSLASLLGPGGLSLTDSPCSRCFLSPGQCSCPPPRGIALLSWLVPVLLHARLSELECWSCTTSSVQTSCYSCCLCWIRKEGRAPDWAGERAQSPHPSATLLLHHRNNVFPVLYSIETIRVFLKLPSQISFAYIPVVKETF